MYQKVQLRPKLNTSNGFNAEICNIKISLANNYFTENPSSRYSAIGLAYLPCRLSCTKVETRFNGLGQNTISLYI